MLELIGKKKKSYTEIAYTCGEKDSSFCEIIKEKKEIHASLAVAPQIAKVRATMCGTCLVLTETSTRDPLRWMT